MPVTDNWASFLLVRGTPFPIVPHDGGIQVQHHYFTTILLVNGTTPLDQQPDLSQATVHVAEDGTIIFE
eukprot:10970105-Ditylum_brightwellii.AAC.1